ncbi:hypothetical protein BGX26_001741, partial [Mortierella sp. AD094]
MNPRKAPEKKLVTEAKEYMENTMPSVNLETSSLCRLVKQGIEGLAQQPPQQQQQHMNIDNLVYGIITLLDELVMHMNPHRGWIHYVMDLYISSPKTPTGDIARLMGADARTMVYGIDNRLRMTIAQLQGSAQ